jgi:hypothetical protein
MDVLKGSNLLIRFLLELCMLAAIGYWGFKTGSGVAMKLILGIGLPLLIAVVWGLFLSPKATHPLRGLSRELVELILFGSGAVALWTSGRTTLGGIYTAVLVVNKVSMIVWKQYDRPFSTSKLAENKRS